MDQPKQVVLMLTDTQRRDMVGIYGRNGIQTPVLDQLAREGVRFERAYCAQPVCGPARSAMFTGLYPHANGSWGNSMRLGTKVKTVAERLAAANIHCAFIGKWHLDGTDYFGSGGCPSGWDPAYWYDMRCYLEELSPEDRRRSRRMQTVFEGDGVAPEFTFAHRCSDRAVRFLREHQNQDFFLVVSYDEPHGPFLAPREYAERYRNWALPDAPNLYDSLDDKPEHVKVWAQSGGRPGAVALAAYFGCNTFVDTEIGRVLEALNTYAPNALTIYTADHGDALGAHGIWNKGPAMYEEITGVPFLVRWRGRVPANVLSTRPLSHIDLTPTIMNAFDLEQPAECHGQSLLPVFENLDHTCSGPIFMEFHRYEIDHDGFGGFQPIRAAIDGQYKLVLNLLTTDELYDLESDPYELTNRIGQDAYRKIRNGLHDQILDWMNRTRDPFRSYYWETRPWRDDARQPTWGYTGMTRQRENDPDEPRQLDYDTGVEMEQAVRRK